MKAKADKKTKKAHKIHNQLCHTQYSGAHLYDLVSAVRGPDSGDDTAMMKGLITARVRVILFGKTPIIGDTEDSVFSAIDYTMLCRLLAKNTKPPSAQYYPYTPPSTHCLNHMSSAVDASHDHRIWGGYARRIVKALQQYIDNNW